MIETGGHGGPVQAMGVDRAGEKLVTGSPDKSVRLWSARDGRLLRCWLMPAGPGETGTVSVAAISPDGRLVVAGGWVSPIDEGERLFCFDVASGAVRWIVGEMPNIPKRIAFSPDGRRLAVGFDAPWGLVVVDVELGRVAWRLPLPVSSVSGVGFRPSGELVALCWDESMVRCDANGTVIGAEWRAGMVNGRPQCLAIDDERRLAVGYQATARLDVWNGSAWQQLEISDERATGVTQLAWLRDGRLASAGSVTEISPDNFVRIWPKDLSRAAAGQSFWGRLLLRGIRPLDLPLPGWAVQSLAALADGGVAVGLNNGEMLAYGGDGTLLWRVPGDRADWWRVRHGFATAEGGRVFRLELPDRAIGALAFDVVGLRLRPAQERSDWYQSPNGLKGDLRDLYPPVVRGERITCVVAGPEGRDGQEMALGSNVGISVWTPGQRPRWQVEHAAMVVGLSLSADHRWLIAAHEDGVVRWYDYRDGRLRLSLFVATDGRRWVAWLPNGDYACVAGSEELIRQYIPHGRDLPGEWAAAPLPPRPDLVAQALEGAD